MPTRPRLWLLQLLIASLALTLPLEGFPPALAGVDTSGRMTPRGTEGVACNPSGDLDGNGLVDCDDYALMTLILGSHPGEPLYNDLRGDLNCDGFVALADGVALITLLYGACGPCGHLVSLTCDGGALAITPAETTAEPGEWVTFSLAPGCYADYCSGTSTSTRTRVIFPASAGLFPAGLNNILSPGEKCHFKVPLTTSSGRYAFTVGPYMGLGFNTPCPDVANNPGQHVLVIPCRQAAYPGPFKTSLYSISGVSGGHGWSWSIGSPDVATMSESNVAAVPAGGTAYQLAQAFAASLNNYLDCPANVMTAQAKLLAGTAYLAITTKGTNKPVLCVGPAGQAATCCPSFAISTQCTFGGNVLLSDALRPGATLLTADPVIEEIPTSELDCNANGQDDTVDIVFGVSPDLNFDGIPDECQASGVSDAVLPFKLQASTPNPFTSTTRLNFELRDAATVRVVVYDLRGRPVRELSRGEMAAGAHSLEWDGRAEGGGQAVAGIYVYALESGGRRATGRLVLLR